ncbi:MAG TPA: hypothetical protein PKD64_13545 [Pirellulaceae bacterium]|nr:hypothetical protein [Pirellulaceae bacterium]HMO93209.1 hypothetical protein [Pirellulaceae bacterium]HMP70040.1 hypothetical protein [Pirellulaceae bacterium]
MKTTCACGKRAKVPDHLIGSVVRCPRCGTILATSGFSRNIESKSSSSSTTVGPGPAQITAKRLPESFVRIWLYGTAISCLLTVVGIAVLIAVNQPRDTTASRSPERIDQPTTNAGNRDGNGQDQQKNNAVGQKSGSKRSSTQFLRNRQEIDESMNLARQWIKALESGKSFEAMKLVDQAQIGFERAISFPQSMVFGFPGGDSWLKKLWENEVFETSLTIESAETHQKLELLGYQELEGYAAPLVRVFHEKRDYVPSYFNLIMHHDNFANLKIVDYYVWNLDAYVYGSTPFSKKSYSRYRVLGAEKHLEQYTRAQIELLNGNNAEALKILQSIPKQIRASYPVYTLMLRAAKDLDRDQMRELIRNQIRINKENTMFYLAGLAACMEARDHAMIMELLDPLILKTGNDPELIKLKQYYATRN